MIGQKLKIRNQHLIYAILRLAFEKSSRWDMIVTSQQSEDAQRQPLHCRVMPKEADTLTVSALENPRNLCLCKV